MNGFRENDNTAQVLGLHEGLFSPLNFSVFSKIFKVRIYNLVFWKLRISLKRKISFSRVLYVSRLNNIRCSSLGHTLELDFLN